MNQVTVTVGVKPSKNYNSVTFQATVTLDVPEGGSVQATLKDAHEQGLLFVDSEADKTLNALNNIAQEF